MTVLEIIQKSSEFLSKKGIESPRLQSELIVAHVLGLQRLQLYLNFDKQVSEKDADSIREMIVKRGKRIPLQHIIGYTEFLGIKIKTDSRALIPRPETEILAETGLELIKDVQSPDVLDFGVGSGCISIAIAVRRQDARVVGLDVSQEAISLATENVNMQNVADRVCLIMSDGFSNLPRDSKFDLIISNPPYVPTEEIPKLQPEVSGHDPVISLNGGEDGLKFYRYLGKNAAPFLKENGYLALEIGYGQTRLISDILTSNGWEILKIIKDYNKIDRVIVAKKTK